MTRAPWPGRHAEPARSVTRGRLAFWASKISRMKAAAAEVRASAGTAPAILEAQARWLEAEARDSEKKLVAAAQRVEVRVSVTKVAADDQTRVRLEEMESER